MSFEIDTDINQDGEWNILDITILMSFIIQESSPNEIEIINADINQDAIIDVLDLILIINIILET